MSTFGVTQTSSKSLLLSSKQEMSHETHLQSIESRIDVKIIHAADDPARTQRFKETVLAVYEIIEKKLYKETSMNIESYFKTHWNISRAQAYRLYNCGAIVRELEEFDVQPSRERYCRILKKITKTPEDLKTLWFAIHFQRITLVDFRAEVLQKVGKNEALVTSSLITSVWNSLMVMKGELDRLVTSNGEPIPSSAVAAKNKIIDQHQPIGHSTRQQLRQVLDGESMRNYPMTPPKSSEFVSPRFSLRKVDSTSYHPYYNDNKHVKSLSTENTPALNDGQKYMSHQGYSEIHRIPISAPANNARNMKGTFAVPESRPISTNSPSARFLPRHSLQPPQTSPGSPVDPKRPSTSSNTPIEYYNQNTWTENNSQDPAYAERYRSYSISTESTSSPVVEIPDSKRSSIGSMPLYRRTSIDASFASQFSGTKLAGHAQNQEYHLPPLQQQQQPQQSSSKDFVGGYENFIQRRSSDLGIIGGNISKQNLSTHKSSSKPSHSSLMASPNSTSPEAVSPSTIPEPVENDEPLRRGGINYILND